MKSLKPDRGSFAAAIVCAASAGLLLAFSADCAAAARRGAELCLGTVIPSIFPFVFISRLCISSGAGSWLSAVFSPALGKLLGVSACGSQAVVLGFLGGYPVGADCAKSLYEDGKITKEEAEYLLGFCNNCGPAFIFGVLGAAVFADMRAAAVLWACHAACAVSAALLTRKRRQFHSPPLQTNAVKEAFGQLFVRSAAEAFKSMGTISVFVILFSVISVIPEKLGLYGLFGNRELSSLIAGIFEITGAVSMLKGRSGPLAMACAGTVIAWGGLSVHMQTLGLISDSGLSAKNLITGKLLHALLSFPAVWAAASLFPARSAQAMYVFYEGGSLSINGRTVLLLTLPWAGLLLLTVLACGAGVKKPVFGEKEITKRNRAEKGTQRGVFSSKNVY